MKKTISLLLSLLLLSALLAGCAAQNEDKKEFHVISTIFAHFDFARNLAGENWDETMLLSPGV
ncbi:MAG: zinc ABC transporter substrate-binding protein, partial [Oscillospiraceae bacterium]|nr:zinc ABC transporter substrate-binding protein [Oscillospiraceae bacterium]